MNIRRATRSFRPTIFGLEQRLTLDGATAAAVPFVFPILEVPIGLQPKPPGTIYNPTPGQWTLSPAPPVSTC